MTEPKSDLMQRLDAWLEEGKAHVAELMKRRQEILQELAKIDRALRAVKGTAAKPAVVVTTHRDYRTIILECLQDADIPLSVKLVQRRVNLALREIGSTKHLTDTTIRAALNKFVLEGTVRKSLESSNPSSGFLYERIRKQDDQPRDDQREERGAGQDRDSGRVPSGSSDATPASPEDSGR